MNGRMHWGVRRRALVIASALLAVGGLAAGVGSAFAVGATCDSTIGANVEPTSSPNYGAATCVRNGSTTVHTNTVFYTRNGGANGGVLEICTGVNSCNGQGLSATGAYIYAPIITPDLGTEPGGSVNNNGSTCYSVNGSSNCPGSLSLLDIGVDRDDVTPTSNTTDPHTFCLLTNGGTCVHPGVKVRIGQGNGSDVVVAGQPLPADLPPECVGLFTNAAAQINC